MSHPPDTFVVMSQECDTIWDRPTVEDLPTPGKLRDPGDRRLPTPDGEPIGDSGRFAIGRREESRSAAIKIRLESQEGCCIMGLSPVVVDTVAEARLAILRQAMRSLGNLAHDPRNPEHLRLRPRADGVAWEDLINCETDRRYDPDDPDAGMRCDYTLYKSGGLEGVGGLIWTFGVYLAAIGPPEVWDHPADQPCGLESEEDQPTSDEPIKESDRLTSREEP